MAQKKEEGLQGMKAEPFPRVREATADSRRLIQEEAKRAADDALSHGQQAMQEARQAAEEQTRRDAEEARRGIEQGTQATADVLRLGQEGAQQAAQAGEAQAEQFGAVLSASMTTYQELAERSREGLERVAQSNARISRALQEMGWETVRFTQDSLRNGLRTATEVTRCRSVEDIAELQREFLRESMDQFFDNSARILRISSDAAAHAVEALRGRGSA